MKSFLALALGFASSVALADSRSNPPTQPVPPLKCSWDQANQIAEKSIRASAEQTPNADGFVVTAQLSATPDDQGFASAVIFSYALTDKDGRVVGLGLVTLDGECQEKSGSFEGRATGPFPVKPLH